MLFPIRRLIKSCFIMICNVCNSVLIFDSDPYLEQYFWPDSKTEEFTSETKGWKGLVSYCGRVFLIYYTLHPICITSLRWSITKLLWGLWLYTSVFKHLRFWSRNSALTTFSFPTSSCRNILKINHRSVYLFEPQTWENVILTCPLNEDSNQHVYPCSLISLRFPN